MAAFKLVDFKDLYDYVLEQLKIPATDIITLNRVKRDLNVVYINEVAPYTRWPWLKKRADLTLPAAYGTGSTALVTEGSTIVTLSSAPSVALGSFANKNFIVKGYPEVLRVSTHTAGSAALTLAAPYTGETSATAGFVIWAEALALPTDCRETIDVKHDHSGRPMQGRGYQLFEELVHRNRTLEGRPLYYTTDDYFDPSSNDAEQEVDRYRQLRIYPAINDKATTLHVDYVQEVAAMDLDGDEPAMPVEDRIVLVYGALRQSWVRDRNPETASLNDQLFQSKLAKMAAKIEDGLDMPRLEIASEYLAWRRNSTSRPRNG